jgi:MFS family permease
VLGIANHVVLSGSRVTVSLDALARGASPFTVGVLMALFALLPTVLALPAGRWCDRAGVKRPMRLGAAGLIVGAALPALVPGMPTLFACAAIVGVSFMAFQVAVQNATGHIGEPGDRARNFSLLALGYSISGFLGPLVAGLAIDHVGFRAAFGVLAALPVAASLVLARRALALPRGARALGARGGGVRALLGHRTLRRVYAINVLYAVGWDLHTLFVPVYGAQLGLSASQIGTVLSVFAAATFVVRLAIPVLIHRFREEHVLAGALFLASAVYFALPLAEGALALAVLSFVLGLGLGSGQPMVMSLLHTHAPPGRVGEAVGMRMSLVQSTSVAVPLLFGAVGASLGLAPVFVLVGLFLAGGGVLARR